MMPESKKPSVRHDILPAMGEQFLPDRPQAEWRDYRMSVTQRLDRLESQLDTIRDRVAKLDATIQLQYSQTALDRITALKALEQETQEKLNTVKSKIKLAQDEVQSNVDKATDRIKANEDILIQRKGAISVWNVLWVAISAIISGLVVYWLTGAAG